MSEAKKPAGKAKAAPATQEAGPMVYIGPDIPGAKQYTTYNAGLPDALKEKIKEHPFFNSLVVPATKLARASAELAKEGSALNILYRRASGK
ncbi:hypothetical protein AALC25_18300 [Lachnospiraceae bacterium 29-84]